MNTEPPLHPVPARRLRACMLAYTFYETDGRVMRYAELLAQEGADVEAIVLRREGQVREEVINGVRVVRIQKREKNERGKFSYLARVLKFFFQSMAEITRRHRVSPYHLIHVHSVPDFEVFASLIPKLGGAKIILDIHDIVPEFYAAKFGVGHDSLVFKGLKTVERWSARFADHVIVANDIWLERIAVRSAVRGKSSALINYPDPSVFHPGLRTRGHDDRFILSYPGTLNWHQGLDIAVKAFALVQASAPGMEFHIHGEGSARAEIERLVDEFQLRGKVHLHAPLPLRQIASVMANADLGVVPKRNDAFGGEAFSTKILEFMAVGIPVVVADTRIDRYYFNEALLRFFTASDEHALAAVMLEAYHGRDRSRDIVSRALTHVRHNNWATKKGHYLDIVRRLVHEPA